MNEEEKKGANWKNKCVQALMLDQVPIEYGTSIRVQRHGISCLLFVYKYVSRPNDTTVSFAKKHYVTTAEPHTPSPVPRPPRTCSLRWCPESLASSRKRSTEAPRADVSRLFCCRFVSSGGGVTESKVYGTNGIFVVDLFARPGFVSQPLYITSCYNSHHP